jgi:hypothetical protein
VLVTNLEVSARQYKKRLRRILAGLGLAEERIRGQLLIDNLKGETADFDNVRERAKRHGAQAVFVDPFYQLFTGSENDDVACKEAVERMKAFHRDGLTLGVVFHSPKGFNGDRLLIDMISGSSILARFPESVLGLMGHATEKDARVFDAVLRNYAPPEAVSVRLAEGVFMADADLPPLVATSKGARTGSASKDKGAEAAAKQSARRRDLLEIVKSAKKPLSVTDAELAMQRRGHGVQAVKAEIKSALAVTDPAPILERQPELDMDSATGRKKQGATYLMTPEGAREYRAQFERLAL